MELKFSKSITIDSIKKTTFNRMSNFYFRLVMTLSLALSACTLGFGQNMEISTGTTTGVTSSISGTVTTFTGSTSGSVVLNRDEIITVLNTGNSVVVLSSGSISVNADVVTSNSAALGGVTIGDAGNPSNIVLASAISIPGSISVYGSLIDINANLTSTSTSGNGISLIGSRIQHRAGRTVATSGANIQYSATNFVPTAASDIVISMDGVSGNLATINAGGGNINLTSSFATGGVAGLGDRALGATFTNIITSGSGSISIIGDATNNLNTESTAWGVQLTSSTIQSENGDITLETTGGKATSNSRGFAVITTSSRVLSATGTITIIDRLPLGLTGTQTGLYLQPDAANTIIFGANGTDVASSSSNIIIRSNRISFVEHLSSFNTSGVVSLIPDDASFGSTLNTSLVNVSSTATGLNLGKAGNTSAITVNRAQNIAGPISVYGGAIELNTNIATTNTSTGNVLLSGATVSGSGNIALANDRSLTIGVSGNGSYAGVISGTISSLIKEGNGTQTLTGNNTYSGTTTINAGILQVGNNGTIGSIGAGNVVNNATFTISRSDDVTLANLISGSSGKLVKQGVGKLTLTANNTYSRRYRNFRRYTFNRSPYRSWG
jgi:autotransporter-associated beta strand protein